MDYSFDGDWGNEQSWAPFTYDYFYRALRSRKTRSAEVRLASPDSKEPGALAWLVGVYTLDLQESLDEASVGTYIDPFDGANSGSSDDHLFSSYDARNFAAFGQVDGWLSDRWGWSFGLRGEQRTADYRDRGIKSESRARPTLHSAIACGAGRGRCTSTPASGCACSRPCRGLQGRRLQPRTSGTAARAVRS